MGKPPIEEEGSGGREGEMIMSQGREKIGEVDA